MYIDPFVLFAVFAIGAWIAAKMVMGGEGWVPLLALAAVFAFLLPGTGYVFAQDATTGIVILALAVGAAQWLLKASVAESAAVVAVTWLAASLLVGGF